MPPANAYYDESGSYPVEARPAPGYRFVSWNGPVADPSAEMPAAIDVPMPRSQFELYRICTGRS